MATLNFSGYTQAGNVQYLSQHHLAKASQIAAHTHACNSLSMAQWNLHSDAGSLRQALAKLNEAEAAIRRLMAIECQISMGDQ